MNENTIQHIQEMLRAVGACSKRIPLIAVDGIWNEATDTALRAFQGEFNLPVTGQPDFETLETLENTYIICRNHLGKAAYITPFPDCETVYKSGDYSPVILILQVMINAIAIRYSNVNNVNYSGRMDQPTVDSVKSLQTCSGLVCNGRVDKITWNSIAMLYNSFATRC